MTVTVRKWERDVLTKKTHRQPTREKDKAKMRVQRHRRDRGRDHQRVTSGPGAYDAGESDSAADVMHSRRDLRQTNYPRKSDRT